jgi:hypothetical protein
MVTKGLLPHLLNAETETMPLPFDCKAVDYPCSNKNTLAFVR